VLQLLSVSLNWGQHANYDPLHQLRWLWRTTSNKLIHKVRTNPWKLNSRLPYAHSSLHAVTFYFVWVSGTNAFIDPEALCNISSYTLPENKCQTFQGKINVFSSNTWSVLSTDGQGENLFCFSSFHVCLQWLFLTSVFSRRSSSVSLWHHCKLWNFTVSWLHTHSSHQINIKMLLGECRYKSKKKGWGGGLNKLDWFVFTFHSWKWSQCFWQEADCSVTPFILAV